MVSLSITYKELCKSLKITKILNSKVNIDCHSYACGSSFHCYVLLVSLVYLKKGIFCYKQHLTMTAAATLTVQVYSAAITDRTGYAAADRLELIYIKVSH